MSQISLKRNILMSGSFRIVVIAITFLTSILTARYLGVELKGKLSFLTAISGFIWMFLDLGLYRSLPYLVRKFPDKTGVFFTWAFIQFIFYSFTLSILGLCLMPFFSRVIGFSFNSIYVLLFVGMITIPMLNMQLQSLYLGLDKIWNHSLAQLINALLMLFFVSLGYFFLHTADRLLYVIAVTILSGFLGVMYYVTYGSGSAVTQQINNLCYKMLELKFVLKSYKSGFRVFLSSLFIMLLIRLDIIIVRRLLDFQQVGIYSIAAQIIDMLQLASNLVGGLLLVKLTDSDNDIEKWNIMKKLLISFSVMLLLANASFIIFGKFLIGNLYGAQFIPVYYVYLWLIPASFGLSFGSLFNMYLNSKGFPVISIILPILSLILNIGLNLIFIPMMKIKGAALATSIAYLFWFLSIIFYEQRYSQGRMFKHLVPHASDWRLLLVETKDLVLKGLKKTKRR